MVKYRAILYLFLTIGISAIANAKAAEYPGYESSSVSEQQGKGMSLEVMINNSTKIKMDNVPTEGHLEVYSILGVKIKSFNLKAYVDSQYCYMDLPKGLYILKAGKTAIKVIVK